MFRLERVQEVGRYLASSIGAIFTVAILVFISILSIYLALDIVSNIGR